jgi:hypothetical protein
VLFHCEDEFNAVKGVETQLLKGGSSRKFSMIALGSTLKDLKDLAFY